MYYYSKRMYLLTQRGNICPCNYMNTEDADTELHQLHYRMLFKISFSKSSICSKHTSCVCMLLKFEYTLNLCSLSHILSRPPPPPHHHSLVLLIDRGIVSSYTPLSALSSGVPQEPPGHRCFIQNEN